MTRFSYVVFLVVLSCGIFAHAIAHAAEITVEEGITYSKVGDVELKLDLARPEGDGPFPAIVCIHGGGWAGGERSHFRPHIEEAAKRGYVAVTISYRLMKADRDDLETAKAEPIFPTQVHDCKAAVRWLRANAENYHVDNKRIGVTGASAGGHLSLMIGLTDPSDKLEGNGGHADQSSRVQAVVNIFGPTEMVSEFQESNVSFLMRLFMGGTPEEVPETYKAGSPATYVSKDDPPVLTIHGDKDELVPVAQARLLDEKMKAVGATHELLILEGQGHGFREEAEKKSRRAMWEFFEKHLKP